MQGKTIYAICHLTVLSALVLIAVLIFLSLRSMSVDVEDLSANQVVLSDSLKDIRERVNDSPVERLLDKDSFRIHPRRIGPDKRKVSLIKLMDGTEIKPYRNPKLDDSRSTSDDTNHWVCVFHQAGLSVHHGHIIKDSKNWKESDVQFYPYGIIRSIEFEPLENEINGRP